MAYDRHDLEIVDHYAQFIHSKSRTFKIVDLPEPAPHPVAVLEFAPPSAEYDWVYTTVGMSRKAMPQSPAQQRSELIFYSRQSNEKIVDFLTKLMAYPFVVGTFFAPGHTVVGSAGTGIVDGSPLTDVLLTVPYFEPPDFEVVRHNDGSHTHILWAIPLYMAERLYVREHGYMELLARFSENSTEASDLWRPPVV